MILKFICFLLLIIEGNGSCSHECHEEKRRSNQSNAEVPAQTCSYMDVLDFLNFAKNSEMYTLTRPVKDHRNKTEIEIIMVIYAILDVTVANQRFTAYVWIVLKWTNELIKWEKEKFCGIGHVIVPTSTLWQPDLTIEEMIEKDKAPPSTFLEVFHDGKVIYRNDQVVISTCKMQVYKFPFDVQNCSISFKSVLYSDDELLFIHNKNTQLANWSKEVMDSQYEWTLINQTVRTETVNYFNYNQTVIVYTFTMSRKSTLYVANFLLPILFFLCLDFASLMMSNSEGEKIGFKITVLLAVTVMQLLLNEILPFTSRRIPLIVIYCIGSFALMLISLMEAVLVKYLQEKDSASQDSKTKSNPSLNEDKDTKQSASVGDMSDQTSSIYKEGSSNQLTEIFLAVEKVSDELEGMKKTLVFCDVNKEEKPGYWTNVATKINKVFTICYLTTAFVFLCTLFSLWTSESDLEQ